MLGAIYGDIIGSTFEWHNVKTEEFELFSHESRFTDDTVMTVAVADKLLWAKNNPNIAKKIRSDLAYAARFKQYYYRYKDAGFGQMFSEWAISDTYRKQNSYGNGAAMRVCPIGYAFDTLDEVLKEAKISCVFTHNNREAINGAKAIAGCVFLARIGESKETIKAFVTKKIGYNINFRLDDIRSKYVFDSRSKYSVPPAIVAFLESKSYESAIRKAISIGGDSDTIACMAGGIAYAFYKEIPKYITNKCNLLLDSGLKTTLMEFNNEFKI